MTITLADIAESEQICEAAIPEPGAKQQVSVAYRTENQLAFEDHARERLPAMNKLAREMVEMVRALAMLACRANDPVACDGLDHCMPCQARRLVERVEEPSHD